MDEDMTIFLMPEGEGGGAFRAKNEDGKKFRTVLVTHGDYGEDLTVKANIVQVSHGTLSPEGQLASLLIFEFKFISQKESRRFKKATVTLTFEDAEKNASNDPEVRRIAPEDLFKMNKTSRSVDITNKTNFGITAGMTPVGGNVGHEWEIKQTKAIEHSARLTGSKRLIRESFSGPENTVIWSMEENRDRDKKDGIPSFLRTAVVLGRTSDEPFSFHIKIQTEVDISSRLEKLFGVGKPEPVDPAEIDPKTLKVGVIPADPDAFANLDELDLWDYCSIKAATVIKGTEPERESGKGKVPESGKGKVPETGKEKVPETGKEKVPETGKEKGTEQVS
jgi:Cornifin (SPRR) family